MIEIVFSLFFDTNQTKKKTTEFMHQPKILPTHNNESNDCKINV